MKLLEENIQGNLYDLEFLRYNTGKYSNKNTLDFIQLKNLALP